jgi:hypothetical protein
VLTESLTGEQQRDAPTERVLNGVQAVVPTNEHVARLAAELRYRAGRGSAVDAIVVAEGASRGGAIVLTGDPDDLSALADAAGDVAVVAV